MQVQKNCNSNICWYYGKEKFLIKNINYNLISKLT
jgi:hypothetical protein